MDAGTGLIDCRSSQSYWNNTLVFEFFSFHFSKTVYLFQNSQKMGEKNGMILSRLLGNIKLCILTDISLLVCQARGYYQNGLIIHGRVLLSIFKKLLFFESFLTQK